MDTGAGARRARRAPRANAPPAPRAPRPPAPAYVASPAPSQPAPRALASAPPPPGTRGSEPTPPRTPPHRTTPRGEPQPPAPQAPTVSPFVGDFVAVARGVALFLGVFSLFNLIGELKAPGFDANLWWIDLRPCPLKTARVFLAFSSVLLLLISLRPVLPQPIRGVAFLTICVLLAISTYNTTTYYSLLRKGTIHTHLALPFSVHVTVCLTMILVALRLRPPDVTTGRQAFLGATTTIFCLVAFPLAQMYCFGRTDYRREADAIVVFGCKVNSNDRPSWALYDRVQTACELHRAGLADVLIVSGGPGEGQAHETDVMRELAIKAGVPEEQILVDRDGLDTAATVRNTTPMLREHKLKRVLAVSHFYHLPRVKLTYRRAGVDVYTVPAKEAHKLNMLPYYLAREVAALWLYYFQPVKRRAL